MIIIGYVRNRIWLSACTERQISRFISKWIIDRTGEKVGAVQRDKSRGLASGSSTRQGGGAGAAGCTERQITSFNKWIIDHTGGRTMLYLTCSMIFSENLAYYRVSHATVRVSGDCATN